jgi:hypothetical protein
MTASLPRITFLTKILVLAGVVHLVTGEATVEGQPGEVLAAESNRSIQAAIGSAPVYWALRNPQVRQQLGLTEQQLDSITEIGREFVKAARGAWVGVKDLTPEERRKKYEEIRRQTQQRMQEARRKIKDVLTAEQYDKLLMAQLRVRGLRVLQGEPCVKALSITEDQRRILEEKTNAMNGKLRQLQRQMQKLRDEAFDDAIEVLTPEQIAKLKDMEARGQRFSGAVAVQAVSAQPRPAAAVRQPMKVRAIQLEKKPVRAQLKVQPAPLLRAEKAQAD